MYWFVGRLTKSKEIGTLSAILYMLMPYHLNDMYIRNALGEFLSYIFIPLVFLGIYKLFQKEKGGWILCVGAVGLILTHILMTLLTAIMAGIYVCVNITKLKDKVILKQLGISIICILGISAFFWIPMLETYFSADYAVYQKDSMATTESFNESGLDIKTLLYTDRKEETTHVFEIGIPILLMLCLSVLAIKKGIDKNYKKEYILFLILGLICTVMTIKQFPWGMLEKIFQIIQFKWRMLLFSNFFFAVICAITMGILIKNFNNKDIIAISSICILYLVMLMPLLQIDPEIQEIDQYTIGEVTEKKTEVIVGMGKGEYLPVKSNDNREYIRTRRNIPYIVKGMRND